MAGASTKKKVLLSAYFCSPYLPSEASGAFKWMTILLKEFKVVLLTNKESEADVNRYYQGNLPENLSVLTFDDDHPLKGVKVQLHFGYFTFNRNLARYIRKDGSMLKDADLILHKNPTSFRYPTCLHLLDVPLIIGPIGGGLQVPKQLKKYFKKEPWINKLRVLDQYLLKLPVIRKAYDKAALLLITLDYLRDILPDKYQDKIRVFFDTGIDAGDGNDHDYRPGETLRILYLGKLIRFKGAELAIRAVLQCKAPVRFDIVGDGVEREFLESLSKELDHDNRIHFHGNVAYEEVEKYYAKADVFLFPSLTEASGNVLLEAMKNGLPIVTVNNGGPQYMCPDEGAVKVGISDPDQMIRELTEGIDRLADSPEKRKEMGMLNFRHCRDTYSWEVLEEKIINLVHEKAK